MFKTLKPIFKTILADGSANIQARQAVSVQQRPGADVDAELNTPVSLTGGNKSGPLYPGGRRRCSGRWFSSRLGPQVEVLNSSSRWSSSLPLQDVQATMECFESLFTRSYARADGTCPSTTPQTSQLHTNALLSWALLLTICAASQLNDILRK